MSALDRNRSRLDMSALRSKISQRKDNFKSPPITQTPLEAVTDDYLLNEKTP